MEKSLIDPYWYRWRDSIRYFNWKGQSDHLYRPRHTGSETVSMNKRPLELCLTCFFVCDVSLVQRYFNYHLHRPQVSVIIKTIFYRDDYVFTITTTRWLSTSSPFRNRLFLGHSCRRPKGVDWLRHHTKHLK